jgi:hypothetical protein
VLEEKKAKPEWRRFFSPVSFGVSKKSAAAEAAARGLLPLRNG